MKKILIPVDGSEYSDRAIEKGKEIADAFDSSVVLLNVVYIPLPIYTYEGERGKSMQLMAETALAQSEDLLKKAKEAFGNRADKVEAVSSEGDIATTITQYVNDHDIDLVIMGSHGMGAVLHRMLVGSVTTKVLHHVQKPVMVVK